MLPYVGLNTKTYIELVYAYKHYERSLYVCYSYFRRFPQAISDFKQIYGINLTRH